MSDIKNQSIAGTENKSDIYKSIVSDNYIPTTDDVPWFLDKQHVVQMNLELKSIYQVLKSIF